MADLKISALTAITGANVDDLDLFAIVDTSATATKNITRAEARKALVSVSVPTAAGVPAGAPTGLIPFKIDSTAVTGGLYAWTGAAWVKVSALP